MSGLSLLLILIIAAMYFVNDIRYRNLIAKKNGLESQLATIRELDSVMFESKAKRDENIGVALYELDLLQRKVAPSGISNTSNQIDYIKELLKDEQ